MGRQKGFTVNKMNQSERLIREVVKLWMPPGRKRCTTCQECKPFAKFSKHPQGRFGLSPVCKLCHAAKWNPIMRARTKARAALRPPPTAKCMRCGENKLASSYPKPPGTRPKAGRIHCLRSRYCTECTALVEGERKGVYDSVKGRRRPGEIRGERLEYGHDLDAVGGQEPAGNTRGRATRTHP